MPESPSEFTSLMERIRQGSEEAVRELLDHYGPHVQRVVRRRLTQSLRAQFDSIDFLQSVWASFFALEPSQYTFECPELLIGFLARVAHNKVVQAFRQRLQTRKHNLNGQHALDSSVVFRTYALAARQPTPSQVAVAEEEWERWLEGQPAHYQQILILLRRGKTHEEIAAELAVSERMVRRVLRKLYAERVT